MSTLDAKLAKMLELKENAEKHIRDLSVYGARRNQDEKDLIRDLGMQTIEFLNNIEIELRRLQEPSELHNLLKTNLVKLDSELADIKDSFFSNTSVNNIKRMYVKIKLEYVIGLLKMFPETFEPYEKLGGRRRSGRKRSGKKCKRTGRKPSGKKRTNKKRTNKKRKSTTRRK
jgi:hypothetical protein